MTRKRRIPMPATRATKDGRRLRGAEFWWGLRHCAHCGRRYVAMHKFQKYDGAECRDAARRERGDALSATK